MLRAVTIYDEYAIERQEDRTATACRVAQMLWRAGVKYDSSHYEHEFIGEGYVIIGNLDNVVKDVEARQGNFALYDAKKRLEETVRGRKK